MRPKQLELLTIATANLSVKSTVKPKGPKPKTFRRQITNTEKGMIIAFFICLGCIQAVADLVGRPWSTVKSFISCTILRNGDQDNLPQSGRPTFLNCQQRREIVAAEIDNHKMFWTNFRDKFTPRLSLATVDRVL